MTKEEIVLLINGVMSDNFDVFLFDDFISISHNDKYTNNIADLVRDILIRNPAIGSEMVSDNAKRELAYLVNDISNDDAI